MQVHCWIRRAGWATLSVLLLFLAAGAVAKEPASGRAGEPKAGPQHPTDLPRLPGAEPTHGAIVAHKVHLSDYWLGIECYLVPPALRAQLDLPEHQGLLVENVMPDSPAAKAGVKPFDILMKVGDKPIKEPGELIRAVDASKDKEMAVELLRGGKTVKVKAKPTRRPEVDAAMAREPEAGEADWDTLRKWLDQTRQRLGQVRPETEMPLRFRFFHPGAILPPGAPLLPELPSNTTIAVSKQGKEPAKITVTRDNDKWEVTENQLDKLPADLRPYVEQMLGRAMAGGQGVGAGIHVAPAPGEPRRPEPRKPPHAAMPSDQPGSTMERRLEQRLERQMDQTNRRIEQLQQSIHELREQMPRQVDDRIERMQRSIEELRERVRDKAPQTPREERRGPGI